MITTFNDVNKDINRTFDAVVVGTGAAGPVAAARLAKAGFSVAMIEEGGYYTSKDFTTNAPEMIKKLYRDAGMRLIYGNPNITFSEGCCVGGGTVINAGVSWRTPEEVLDKWQKELGIDASSPESMESYFDEIEERLHVAPQDEDSLGMDVKLFRDGSLRMGFKTVPVLRNQIHCCGCNNCIMGCPADAKQSTLITYIPDALKNGAELFTDCRIEKILMKGKEAVGVEGLFRKRGRGSYLRESKNSIGNGLHKLTIKAKIVILACGALETPALMLRSGIRSNHVGKNLFVHPNVKGVAVFPENVYGWKGTVQGWQVHEFLPQGLLMATTHVPLAFIGLFNKGVGNSNYETAKLYNRMVMCGVLSEDTTTGRVTITRGGATKAYYRITSLDVERFKDGLVHLADLLFAAGADEMSLPFRGAGNLSRSQGSAPIKSMHPRKGDVEVLTVHAMGTTRMGNDTSDSVVDPFGKVHGASNLFVVDASLFPSPVKVNPQLSIMAFAARNADYVIEQFKPSGKL